MRTSPAHAAVQITAPYLLLATLWIFFSDRTLLALGLSVEALSQLQTTKGLLFVLVTGGVLFGLVRHGFGRQYAVLAALRDSEARFRAVFQHAPVGMAVLDNAGQVLLSNQVLQKTLGFAPTELQQKPLFDLTFDDPVMVGNRYQAVLRSDALDYRAELHYRRKNGELRCASLTLAAAPSPQQQTGIGILMLEDITERLQAAQQASRWQRVFEVANFALAHIDVATNRFAEVNPKFASERGYTPQQLVGQTLLEIHPPELHERLAQHLRDLDQTGHLVYESEHLRKDGSRFPVLLDITVTRDAQGRAVGRIAYALDITDRKRAELDAQRRNTELETVFQALPDLYFRLAGDGTVLDYRAQRDAELYVPPDTFLGKRVQQILPATVVDRLEQSLALMRREQRLVSFEYELQMPSGIRSFEARITPVADAGEFIAIIRDITETRRAALALEESEARYRSLVESTPDWVWEVDAAGRYTYVSPRCRDLLGYAPEELLGCTPMQLMPPAEAERIGTLLAELAAQKAPITALVNVNLHKAGHEVTLETSGQPIVDRQGTLLGYRGVDRDVTERLRAEQALRAAHEHLEDRVRARTAELSVANRELESFTYSVSHDLRAPLRAIHGFSQALIEDYGPALPDGARAFLDHIKTGSTRMGDLIDGLLTLSRNARGELCREPVDLGALALDILNGLATEDPDRNVTIRVDPGLVAAADLRLAKTLLSNLLGNAWKYTGRRSTAEIHFYSIEKEGEQVFCVSDNGAGFDMQFAPKLFEPFQRLHRPDEFAGIGIGLATVQRIVYRHGGWIEGHGVPGKGASFCFTLAPRRTTPPGHGS